MGEPAGILAKDAIVSSSAAERLALRNADLTKPKDEEKKTNRQIIEDAQSLAGRYDLNNGVIGRYEITKTDLHNLVYEISKELKDDREVIIPRLRDIIEKGEYVGWAEDDGSHPDVAYFTYYSDMIGRKIYLGMKYMKSAKVYKPHAIYSETEFENGRAKEMKKGTPTM